MSHFRKVCTECCGKGYVEDENVVVGDFFSTQRNEPDQVLLSAVGELENVLVLGNTKDGMEFSASSEADAFLLLWIAQRFSQKLLAGSYHGD